VAANSPQFSALVAATAPSQQKGTALTFVVCIGFAITILSIFFLDQIAHRLASNSSIFALLSIGPALGLFCMIPLMNKSKR
jgi:hypothetical protein